MLIKIGDLYINQDHITDIWVGLECISVFTDVVCEKHQVSYDFYGERRQALLDWLEYKAEVSVVI